MYFRGDPLLAQEEELLRLPEARREVLIADAIPDASGLVLFQFDIVLTTA